MLIQRYFKTISDHFSSRIASIGKEENPDIARIPSRIPHSGINLPTVYPTNPANRIFSINNIVVNFLPFLRRYKLCPSHPTIAIPAVLQTSTILWM